MKSITSLYYLKSRSGPYKVYNPYSKKTEGDVEKEIWQKFVDYKDKNGYYFLQYFEKCSKTDEFTWGYYPPDKFKILLYFPKEDKFISSNVYERYAFDSYYRVDVKNLRMKEVSKSEAIIVKKDYNAQREVGSLFGRMVVTILAELAVAFFFCYRSRRDVLLIIGVNFFTQILLNVLLNVFSKYLIGSYYLIGYFLLEVLVIIMEAVIYMKVLITSSEEKENRHFTPAVYAVTANLLSFGIGMVLVQIVPRMF